MIFFVTWRSGWWTMGGPVYFPVRGHGAGGCWLEPPSIRHHNSFVPPCWAFHFFSVLYHGGCLSLLTIVGMALDGGNQTKKCTSIAFQGILSHEQRLAPDTVSKLPTDWRLDHVPTGISQVCCHSPTCTYDESPCVVFDWTGSGAFPMGDRVKYYAEMAFMYSFVLDPSWVDKRHGMIYLVWQVVRQ
jgi:hypothetical protein